jgi:hypothetical protein
LTFLQKAPVPHSPIITATLLLMSAFHNSELCLVVVEFVL